eukprot:CAMPEP_0113472134 /NCGR_PEP_ID=MMETSP0014_2-20120614/17352_1 /TAXON_ID=2857 /ORGANISM="Nitzschia sp." /LENGTH=175 /DNA_ID=CAMNT_0000364821 /DNA_START=151 /DNA_END=675 /DNA_ORIENTATION=+ /assembly_acc=CAM_ASM_000159
MPTPAAAAATTMINSNNSSDRNGTVARLRIRPEWWRRQGCRTPILLLLLSLNILLVNGEIVSTKSSNTTAMMDMIKDRLIQSNLLLGNGTEFEPLLLTSPSNNTGNTSSSAADGTTATNATTTNTTTASTNATTTTTTPAETVYYTSTPSYQYDALQRTSQVVGVEFMSLSKVIQ